MLYIPYIKVLYNTHNTLTFTFCRAIDEIKKLGGNVILETIVDKLALLYKNVPSPTGGDPPKL